MAVKRVAPIIKVTDLRLAIECYCSTLGFVADFSDSASPDGPAHVGVSLDGNQLHDDLFRKVRLAGLKTPGNPDSPVDEGPVDQTWGMREFYVRDPDGNTLRFGSPSPQAG